jgi:aspartate ammonia-lyase
MAAEYRSEQDALGSVDIPAEALYGVHSARAMDNFPLSGVRLSEVFIRSYAEVKLACARTNRELGFLAQETAGAIETACLEMIGGKHHDHILVDAFQGGAGTSTNMNMNEVLANRAGELLGSPYGSYVVHPLHHVNQHQSTNDTYPTALKVAVLHELKRLEISVSGCNARNRSFRPYQDWPGPSCRTLFPSLRA